MHEDVSGSEPRRDVPHLALMAQIDRELALAIDDGHSLTGFAQRADDRSADAAGTACHHGRPLHGPDANGRGGDP